MAENSSINSPASNPCNSVVHVDLGADEATVVNASSRRSFKEHASLSAPFADYKFKYGLHEIDIDEVERELFSLNVDETEVYPAQKVDKVNLLRITHFVEKSVKNSEKSENSADQTEPGEGSCSEEQKKEKLTEFKYEKKNKLLDQEHLRQICKEFFLDKIGDVNCTEEFLENRIRGNDMPPAVNVLRRIAYPKLCEKHFSPEFPTAAFAETDEPEENININMEHFEFLHEEKNFLELLKSDSVTFDWEKNPQINNIVPSFIKHLKSDSKFHFPQECFGLILAILKNPYRKFEYFFDDKLPVVIEQMALGEYLLNCLLKLDILDNETVYEKLEETIIRFANIHSSFLAQILAGFKDILSSLKDGEYANRICCNVLNIMSSIGATLIDLCLPEYFEKISCLAANDQTCELYCHLLRACEISFTNILENKSQVESVSPKEIDLGSFYTACCNYFGSALTTCLIPAFKKYEERKDREEQYFSKKHSIFPTKDGYMNTEMRFLSNRNKKMTGLESSNFPSVKKCEFNSAGKVKFSSSNQLGYVIQEDMFGLSDEDLKYWDTIEHIPLSYLEQVTDLINQV